VGNRWYRDELKDECGREIGIIARSASDAAHAMALVDNGAWMSQPDVSHD
jgi:hypothetical protein